MATRASDLTETAAPVADRLAKDHGIFKNMLSAAVLAFDWLPAEYQRVFMNRARGGDRPLPDLEEVKFRVWLESILDKAFTAVDDEALAKEMVEAAEADEARQTGTTADAAAKSSQSGKSRGRGRKTG